MLCAQPYGALSSQVGLTPTVSLTDAHFLRRLNVTTTPSTEDWLPCSTAILGSRWLISIHFCVQCICIDSQHGAYSLGIFPNGKKVVSTLASGQYLLSMLGIYTALSFKELKFSHIPHLLLKLMFSQLFIKQ